MTPRAENRAHETRVVGGHPMNAHDSDAGAQQQLPRDVEGSSVAHDMRALCRSEAVNSSDFVGTGPPPCADFGVSRILHEKSMASTVIGTPYYM